MRAVIQRVKEARVEVGQRMIGRIGCGLLVLLGVGRDDEEVDASWLASKIAGLRIFSDPEGRMNLSLLETGGSVLAVSQFTLYGDCRHGRRPDFTAAARPEQALRLYDFFCRALRDKGIPVAEGEFGGYMEVRLTNDGPVTILIDTKLR